MGQRKQCFRNVVMTFLTMEGAWLKGKNVETVANSDTLKKFVAPKRQSHSNSRRQDSDNQVNREENELNVDDQPEVKKTFIVHIINNASALFTKVKTRQTDIHV